MKMTTSEHDYNHVWSKVEGDYDYDNEGTCSHTIEEHIPREDLPSDRTIFASAAILGTIGAIIAYWVMH